MRGTRKGRLWGRWIGVLDCLCVLCVVSLGCLRSGPSCRVLCMKFSFVLVLFACSAVFSCCLRLSWLTLWLHRMASDSIVWYCMYSPRKGGNITIMKDSMSTATKGTRPTRRVEEGTAEEEEEEELRESRRGMWWEYHRQRRGQGESIAGVQGKAETNSMLWEAVAEQTVAQAIQGLREKPKRLV